MAYQPQRILDYQARSQRRLRVSRRQFLLFLLFGALGVCGWLYGPWLYRQLRFQYRQHLCLIHESPAETVVYSNDPPIVSLLLRSPEYSGRRHDAEVHRPAPPEALALGRLQPTSGGFGNAFLHELRSPDGNRWLVAMDFVADARRDEAQLCNFTVRAVTPFGQTPNLNWVVVQWFLARLPSDRLTILSGQVDPRDGSHFTVAFVVNGQRTTLDAWVQNGGDLRISPRGGEIKKGSPFIRTTEDPPFPPTTVWLAPGTGASRGLSREAMWLLADFGFVFYPDLDPLMPVVLPRIIRDVLSGTNVSDDHRRGALQLLQHAAVTPGRFSPLVRPFLGSGNTAVRLEAIGAMGAVGTSDDAGAIRSLLNDESNDVRRAALVALGNLGTAEELPLLTAWHQGDQAADARNAAENMWLRADVQGDYAEAIRKIEARAAAATRPATAPSSRPAGAPSRRVGDIGY